MMMLFTDACKDKWLSIVHLFVWYEPVTVRMQGVYFSIVQMQLMFGEQRVFGLL